LTVVELVGLLGAVDGDLIWVIGMGSVDETECSLILGITHVWVKAMQARSNFPVDPYRVRRVVQ